MSEYRCDHCTRRLSAPVLLWRCGCGGPLSIVARGRFDPRAIASRPLDIWRYREAITTGRPADPVTLGEGFTPIVDREILGLPARFKLEFLSPTGSFKDRGASVVMTQMAASGVDRAVEDSSGNAGQAMAAYASRAGIAVEVLVPDDAPAPKLAAIEACGGRLVRVSGGRAAASAAALQRAEAGLPYASHVWNPFFLEGTKTFAFEIWEQTDRRIPPRIFLPVGNGSLLIGAFDGFASLREHGLCDRVPRLVGVQAEVCAPLVTPREGRERAPLGERSLADGIRIIAPPRARRAAEAVERTGGEFLSVPEAAIEETWRALARSGLHVEPTAAVALAGALDWARSDVSRREMDAEGPPLIALTGSGLKVPS